jgi:transposase
MMDLSAFLAPLEREAVQTSEPIRAVLENTTNARAIQRMLIQYGQAAGIDLTVDVLDPRKIRIIAESVCKCDRLDAQVLNDLARSTFQLPVCYVADDEEFALREHLRARSELVRMRTMLKNRIHAVLHRRGILTPTVGLFSKAGRTFLDQQTLDDTGRTIVDRYLARMDDLDGTIAESTASLRELARRPRWADSVKRLRTMPGIGLLTALTILAELGRIDRFRRRASVANYAGLVPIRRDSNQKHYSGGISHCGSRHLRAILVEAAWIAVPRVPAYGHLFDRIREKKNKPTAIVAVARRMLEDAFTMLQKNQVFRYAPVPDAAGESPVDAKPPAGASRCDRTIASSVAG